MLNLGKSKSLVGLDIGSSSVKAIELKKARDGYELVSFGLEPLTQDGRTNRQSQYETSHSGRAALNHAPPCLVTRVLCK